ncbi:MAG: hypothetical protein H6672_20535 [Anaerolineaceae bacterium]|nr:hypothetical protein [Anaerolineaceae bacterium]
MVTLVVYSVFEAGLSSALAGFVMNRWHRPPIQAKHLVLIVVVLRAGLAVGGLAAYNLFIAINEWATRGDDAALCSLLSESDAIVDDYWGVDSRYLSSIMPHMMLENVAIIPFTLVDNATLLSSDLMRQSWYWLAIAQRIPALLGGLLLYIGVIRGFYGHLRAGIHSPPLCLVLPNYIARSCSAACSGVVVSSSLEFHHAELFGIANEPGLFTGFR